MKLKYYLRGLGIGIIIAVIIMIIAFRIHGSEMSDEQVIKRAQELGMVMPESGAVGDLREKQQAEQDQTAPEGQTDTDAGENADTKNEAGTGENADTENEAGTGENADVSKTDKNNASAGETANQDQADQAGSTQSNTKENAGSTSPGAAGTGKTGEVITFVVSGGEYSDKISQNLQAAGLIEDAESYNKWLQETDYDNFIQPGTFQIPVGSTWDEIAIILTTKEENQGQP